MFRKKVREKKRHFIASAFTIVAEHFEIGVLGTDLLCNEVGGGVGQQGCFEKLSFVFSKALCALAARLL